MDFYRFLGSFLKKRLREYSWEKSGWRLDVFLHLLHLRLTESGTPWTARGSSGCSFHTVAETNILCWSTFQPGSGDFGRLNPLWHILKLEKELYRYHSLTSSFLYSIDIYGFLNFFFFKKVHLPAVNNERMAAWMWSFDIFGCITAWMTDSCVFLLPSWPDT